MNNRCLTMGGNSLITNEQGNIILTFSWIHVS